MTLTVTDLLARTEPAGDCLIWMGWKNDDGYGYVRFEGKDQPAHRTVYLLAVGLIPPSHEVDHLCQQRDCLRIQHLEVVTHAENQRRIAVRQMA
jgi:HNH endonuclease